MTKQNTDEVNQRIDLWFQLEMPKLFRYLCYRTCTRAAAEELTSVICEKAIQKIAAYDPSRGEIRLWIFGIARNELRMFFRARKGEPAEVSIDLLPDFVIQANSPEDEYQQKEAFLQIIQAIRRLPEREQELISLRYGAGLPVKEIAGILNMNENQVSVILHRSLDKIRSIQLEVCNEPA
jgi:RNA polymerase sigma factor (sigma-70 family)